MLKTDPETPSDAFHDVPPEGPVGVVGQGVAPGSGLKWGVHSSQFDGHGCRRGLVEVEAEEVWGPAPLMIRSRRSQGEIGTISDKPTNET